MHRPCQNCQQYFDIREHYGKCPNCNFDNFKNMIYIGIDPDIEKCGYAVWDTSDKSSVWIMTLQPLHIIPGTRIKSKLNGNNWVVDRLYFDSNMKKKSVDIRLAVSKDSVVHEGVIIETILERFERVL